MEGVLIVVIVLGFLYYYQNKKSKEGVEEIINHVKEASDTEYEELVKQKQDQLEKTKLKNLVTKEFFYYFGKGNFIRSSNDMSNPVYLNIVENQFYIEEFQTEPRYSVTGTYNTDYYIMYFEEKAYVSVPLLHTLYVFDESKWREILYPVEFINEFGYNFLEFLALALPERHPDDKWLKDTSSPSCDRSYFKDLTATEILSVPISIPLNKNSTI